MKKYCQRYMIFCAGSVAHLGERIVRNDEVASSSLVRSTILKRLNQCIAKVLFLTKNHGFYVSVKDFQTRTTEHFNLSS